MPEFTLPKRMQSLMETTTETMTRSSKRLLDASRGAFDMTREEAESILSRGEDLFEKLVERGEGIEQQEADRVNNWLKSWEQRGRKQIHVAEEQLEAQVQNVLRALHLPTMDEIQRLDQELERISQKLDMQMAEKELEALPIANYKHMNVKEVVAVLPTLDRHGLIAVQKYEMAHANRKTILREIEERLESPGIIPESA